MKQLTCNFCGDTYPDFDVAHVCSKGKYAPQTMPRQEPSNLVKMWEDPRFQLYADMIQLLEGSRIWGGQDWTYHPIHPFKYLPIKERVRAALDAVKAEYGVEE